MQLYWEIGTYSHSEIELYMHYMRGSRNFHQGGGGGVQVNLTKKALTTFFLFFYSSTYFTEVKWLISKKTIMFQGSGGGPLFSRGVLIFPGGGVQLLIP